MHVCCRYVIFLHLHLQEIHFHRRCPRLRSPSLHRPSRQDHMQWKWRIHAIHNMHRVKLGKEHMMLGQPAQTSVFFHQIVYMIPSNRNMQ